MIEQRWKTQRFFCTHMVDFYRPSHIYNSSYIGLIASYILHATYKTIGGLYLKSWTLGLLVV